MSRDEPDQEVWITLRLKGSMPLSIDPHLTAEMLLKRIEAYLMHGPQEPRAPFWQRIFIRKPRDLPFALTQPAEIIEVEEEAEIYETDHPVL
ncbi:MAG: hypothetical protein ABL907_16505 [Hyphomicrobium sp.]